MPQPPEQSSAEAIESWMARAHSSESHERADAADDPPTLSDARVRDSLLRLLGDDDALMRACAAESLANLRDPIVFAALESALAREADPMAAAHVAGALGPAADLSRMSRVLALADGLTGRARLHCLLGAYLGMTRSLAGEFERLLQQDDVEISPLVDGLGLVGDELSHAASRLAPLLAGVASSGNAPADWLARDVLANWRPK